MKLNMIFIVMDLLTLLIYPLVFMHGRLRRFVKESILLEKPLAAASVALNK